MPTYLIHFAQFHEEFRLPELFSLAKLEKVHLECDESTYRLDNPYFKVTLDSEQEAQKLVKRAILIKKIYELWAEANSYDEIHAQVKDQPELWKGKYDEASFKFSVSAFNSTISVPQQREIINSFSYLGFNGPISMSNPDNRFCVLEDYGSALPQLGVEPAREWIYMGRLVASGSRDVVQKYNLKKRKYLGTTSMDAELSLVMANQAQAGSGKLIYDPFVGTGSFLFTCAHFGAFTLGSDIDGRQIRGKGKSSVRSNIEQYSLQGRVLDSLVFDVCHHPWRTKAWLDAIVTDPPYGVRAGAKRLGRKEDSKKTLQMRTYEGVPMHTREDYYPPTKPYEMSEVLADLLNFAAEHLRVGGRLVYWLPTVVDEYSSADIPQHPSMTLISNSEQNFGQWARRLITMEKVREFDASQRITAHDTESSCIPKEQAEPQQQPDTTPATNSSPSSSSLEASSEQIEDPKRPGHYLFREKYFNFGRSTPESSGNSASGSEAK
ncbi:S-adenosyl-L-methionine-dependent methyltransferase [Zychaea mexicana]|uniref:S-adenosyl-L-methionine-dependent methyltransferase n=1 Tax=Zychaea mexicana TaxID=64656 RepID=UPI0022FE6F4D|nr:S-adenosyl-L-methionine-dependent methyltransferase [Zychaea mexicana]KAI9495073.1 S-adenosyl-L-methionine-dependent methyltransferase [Zychaea mexicana]